MRRASFSTPLCANSASAYIEQICVKQLVRFCLFLSLLTIVVPCTGQSALLPTRATPDGEMIVPVKTGLLGQKDEGAIAELKAHQTAVGGNPWTGMMATGKITYGSDSSISYDATLSNMRDYAFRLDAGAKSGETTVGIFQGLGKIKATDGTIFPLDPDTALSGLFPFEMVRVDPALIGSAPISLTDHGTTTVGSSVLHRITLESPSFGPLTAAIAQQTHAIDFYFDPTTHLLAKSAVYETVPGSRNVKFLFVVSYGDYRSVGNVLVPFRYTETMEGETVRTLQLSTVQLNPSFAPQDFQL